MKKTLLTLALIVAAPAFSASCTYQLPPINKTDSIQAVRAKLFISGLFPIYQQPSESTTKPRKLGFFEFRECLHSAAFNGCYSEWITRTGESIEIAYPATGLPFISACRST